MGQEWVLPHYSSKKSSLRYGIPIVEIGGFKVVQKIRYREQQECPCVLRSRFREIEISIPPVASRMPSSRSNTIAVDVSLEKWNGTTTGLPLMYSLVVSFRHEIRRGSKDEAENGTKVHGVVAFLQQHYCTARRLSEGPGADNCILLHQRAFRGFLEDSEEDLHTLISKFNLN